MPRLHRHRPDPGHDLHLPGVRHRLRGQPGRRRHRDDHRLQRRRRPAPTPTPIKAAGCRRPSGGSASPPVPPPTTGPASPTASSASAVTRGAAGAIIGDTDTASTFNGTATAWSPRRPAVTGPDTFTIEAWVKTTTTTRRQDHRLRQPAGRRVEQLRPPHLHGQRRPHLSSASTPAASRTGQHHQVLQRRPVAPDRQHARPDGHGAVRRRHAGRPRARDVTTGAALHRLLAGRRRQPQRLAGSAGQQLPQRRHRRGRDLPDRAEPGPGRWPSTSPAAAPSPIPAAPADTYGAAVYNDQPDLYWRLGDSTGDAAADSSA